MEQLELLEVLAHGKAVHGSPSDVLSRLQHVERKLRDQKMESRLLCQQAALDQRRSLRDLQATKHDLDVARQGSQYIPEPYSSLNFNLF